ncbi:hypothetical protein AJ88_26495 [Mesorhizobium amorphae CCBAU 01583]|nr:hypothetical protein AJ88_26495 [Mesorhizobium amorphae CCBAU 01583]
MTTISVACGVPPAAAIFGASGCASLNGFAAGATVPVVVLSTCVAGGASTGAEAVRTGFAAAGAGCETGGSCCTETGSRLERLTD